MQKETPQSGKQISAEEKQKTLESVSWSKTETMIYPLLRITKVSKNRDEIRFDRNETIIRFQYIQLWL